MRVCRVDFLSNSTTVDHGVHGGQCQGCPDAHGGTSLDLSGHGTGPQVSLEQTRQVFLQEEQKAATRMSEEPRPGYTPICTTAKTGNSPLSSPFGP